MGKILYGVMGDSGGHLSRSLAIARQLKGHEIVFVGGGRVKEAGQYGYSVVEAPLLGKIVTDSRVDAAATVKNAIRLIARRSRIVDHLQGIIRDFDPDLILSDFEYFLPMAARKLGRACVSVDRQHVLTNCSFIPPSGHNSSRFLTANIIRAMHSAPSRYLVCSFVPMKPENSELTEIFPPVLRPEVMQISPHPGDHAVVYLYGASIAWIRKTFGGRKRRYLIYGHNHAGTEGNLSFRSYSVEKFLTDVAGSAYVVSHGGHNLISEALHYGKPILCYPVDWEYEQYFNARLVEDEGYGACGNRHEGAAQIDEFEMNLHGYSKNASAYRPWSDHSIAGRLEQFIAQRISK